MLQPHTLNLEQVGPRREVRNSLSDGKTLVRVGNEAERAVMDSPKMVCQTGECRTFLPPEKG